MRAKHNGEKIGNYILVLAETIIFLVVTFIIGIVISNLYLYNIKETEDETTYRRYYALITEDQKSSFWQSVYQGAYEAGIAGNAYVEMLGSNLSTVYPKEDLMRIAIDSGVDGIIVEADESEQMTKLINEAMNADIPVVTLYGDSPQSDRVCFVGVGSYNLGREYGKQILKIAEEKEKEHVEVAVLVNSYMQNAGQNVLCSGIQETVENAKKEGRDIAITLMTVDDTNAFSVEESIRDIFMEKNLPDIIICLNELDTTCVYQAVVDYNKVGQVSILGYYDSETITKAIERNVIYATASVDTRQMGRFCIEALTEHYDYGNTSQYLTADVTLINKDNVSQYPGGDEDEK